MHNVRWPTPNQTLENEQMSPMRVTNEWDIGDVILKFKYTDFYKVLNPTLQPLSLFYRVCCILSNAFNILDHNKTSKYYDCPPPRSLEEYFLPIVE